MAGSWSRELAAQIRSAISALPEGTVHSRVAAALSVDTAIDFAALTRPILALHARCDLISFPFIISKLSNIRPDAIIHGFDAPHMLLQSKPAEAAAEIARFISGIG